MYFMKLWKMQCNGINIQVVLGLLNIVTKNWLHFFKHRGGVEQSYIERMAYSVGVQCVSGS